LLTFNHKIYENMYAYLYRVKVNFDLFVA